jgi:hypothetical protein
MVIRMTACSGMARSKNIFAAPKHILFEVISD